MGQNQTRTGVAWCILVMLLALLAFEVGCQPTPISTTTFTSIAAGFSHTCALTSLGGVKCWGYNSSGELGDGTTTNRLRPVDVIGLTSGVVAIATGKEHTCALTSVGGVKCWGHNYWGQLGDGTTMDRLIPVDVSGLSGGAVTIAAGVYHTCALTSGGRVKCWGYNNFGQLGDGTTTSRSLPIDVSSLTSSVTAIALGGSFSCARTSSNIMCWGFNLDGQLGEGTTTNRLSPTSANWPTSDMRVIMAGGAFNCALMKSGGVECWGRNLEGQLGDGTKIDHFSPVSALGLTGGVTQITAGVGHACVRMTAGGAKCWGNNSNGQLGDGTTTDRQTPVDVRGLTTSVTMIAAGGNHTCVLSAGKIECWGLNDAGQLGDGTTTTSSTPVEIGAQ